MPTVRNADASLPAACSPFATQDVTHALADWPHEPGGLAARLIEGDRGGRKLQLRIELGVLQMEIAGRPDGRRPAGGRFGSELQWHRERVRLHRQRHKPAGFALRSVEAESLEEEGRLFARRYLAWFVLGEWRAAARDARHHLAILDFLRQHARPGIAGRARAQWLPYAVMMAARAESAALCGEGELRAALKVVTAAQRRLKRHFRSHGGQAAYEASESTASLKTVARRLRKTIPQSEVRRLRRTLREAVQAEQYEQAARLRDQILQRGGRL